MPNVYWGRGRERTFPNGSADTWWLVIKSKTFQHLVNNKNITEADLAAAIAFAAGGQTDLETLLIEKYKVSATDLGQCLSQYYQCPYIPYSERIMVDASLLKSLNVGYLKKNYWVPLKREVNTLDVLVDDPHDMDKGQDIKRAFPGMTIRFAVGLRRDIVQFLQSLGGQAHYGSVTAILGEMATESQQEAREEAIASTAEANDNANVRLGNQIIADAYRLGASDIHIEPRPDNKETVVRFRVDGTCFDYMKIPSSYRRAIVSRLKVMAHLDISERRLPQGGKIKFQLGGGDEIELRIETMPTAGNNEDAVLRILTAKRSYALDNLGLTPTVLGQIKMVADKPYGMILCVGPTGSGKTTTLHAILAHINKPERKIWTAEDPIEITQDGLRQVQVNPKIGLTFKKAMTAFLRSDPDVIMIGEMRDKETADIAIEASLTGHLVLSTLHTNSAVETVIRLLDLGCDPFSFADAMLGIIAKRLCKRICQDCKEEYHPAQEEYDELVAGYGGAERWKALGVEHSRSFKLFRGKGCDVCNHTGFKGRIGLHEMLVGSEQLRRLILRRAPTDEFFEFAQDQGMTTLLQDGILKVLEGETIFKQARAVAMK